MSFGYDNLRTQWDDVLANYKKVVSVHVPWVEVDDEETLECIDEQWEAERMGWGINLSQRYFNGNKMCPIESHL
jgi:hypothetical protein